MTIRRVTRAANRTTEETAQLRAARERYQRSKPTVEQLLAEGGHEDTVPLGEFLATQEIMLGLKKERERQQLTLAELAERTGIDQAALSRLETGKQANTTIDTLSRIARALGKLLVYSLQDMPASR
jgi:DNA-binding Xre family transcriptional regulator